MNLNFLNFTNEDKINSFHILQNAILKSNSENKPIFVGRLSGNEPNLCGCLLKKQTIPPQLYQEMLTTAGIQFLNENDIKKYFELYTKACINSSLLGVWSGSMFNQAKLFYEFLNKVKNTNTYVCAQALEPYYFMENNNYNFPELFKNKKVLIITSHAETTKKQIKKQNLFNKPIFHDNTSFFIYKPPQQNGGNHDKNSWIYHFENMKNELKNIKEYVFNFDIALVSCGGLGMIISDYIFNELKSSVIYVGGALQLYFGIIGNRWKSHPIISTFINTNWCNVLDIDKPQTLKKNPSLCENSCYW